MIQTRVCSMVDIPTDPQSALVTTGEDFEKWVRFMDSRPWLVFDYETTGVRYYKGAQSVGMGMGSWDDQGRLWTCYVPYRHRMWKPQLDFNLIAPAFKQLLAKTTTLKIAHNIKFEDHFSRVEGWTVEGPRYDTMVAARLYDENRSAQLEVRADEDLGYGPVAWEGKQLLEADILRLAKQNKMGIRAYKEQFGYSEVDTEVCGYYGTRDIKHTGELYQFYEKYGVTSFFSRIWDTEMHLTRILADMESAGMPVNQEYLSNLQETLKQHKTRLEGSIAHALNGYQLNIGSDEELRHWILGVLGLRLWKRTKGGKYAVDKDVLDEIQHQHPAIPLIMDWRKADKIDSTYTQSVIDRLDQSLYVHGDLQSVGTNTGRLSCREPNYQNFPTDSDDRAIIYSGRSLKDGGWDPWSIKRAFEVPPGHVRIYADYSQIELRVMAYYSQDPIMVDAYLRGEDIHDRTSREVQVTRRIAKVINFGLCIAEGQEVLTDHGLVLIEWVQPWHKVWDGVEWVSHDGIVCRGAQEVITYDGLTATPEHEVYTEDGDRVSIGELASEIRPRRIAVGAAGGVPVRYSYPDGGGWIPGAQSGGGGDVYGVPQIEARICGQYQAEAHQGLYLSEGQVQGFQGKGVRGALRFYGAALREGYARLLTELQGAWYQGAVQFAGAFHQVGLGEVAPYGLQGVGLRSNRQRGALQSGESATYYTEGQRQQWPQVAKVYDILNAGPRHRFTVAGKLVSNSYCMTPPGLARTVKISRAEAEHFMNEFFKRYQGIVAFRAGLWTRARQQGCQIQNIFGRRRFVAKLGSADMKERVRGERQVIATLIQGTAAELTKESLVRLDREFRARGLPAKLVNTVHDEIQIDVPREYAVPVAQVMKAEMERFPEFSPIPIIVDLEITQTNWAEKRPMELAE